MDDPELTPPPAPTISSGGAPRANADGSADWTCANCSNVNFAWRNACNRCAKDRGPASAAGGTVSSGAAASAAAKRKKLGQEIGKAAAEKSRGLFSADDWQCNKCGNVNWARRQQCNVCNAPKFGEVEERTGLGGGYNDRGVVEYKERTDSDDEYDEFGRRKKRRHNDEPDSHSDDANDKKKKDEEDEREEEDEEEEEDDDDDEVDLSKYDLSDWGVDAGAADNNDGDEKRHRSRSRTRSRSPHRK